MNIITLCGSTKFKNEFLEMNEKLTLEGNVVISVSMFGHADNKFGNIITPDVKKLLDEVHLRKIDLSNEIFVINVGGYIGESTKKEIQYAKKTGKNIRYLEE